MCTFEKESRQGEVGCTHPQLGLLSNFVQEYLNIDPELGVEIHLILPGSVSQMPDHNQTDLDESNANPWDPLDLIKCADPWDPLDLIKWM